MLRVTFYSYKGGVGRTLALLNVAAILAMNGRKVMVVDLDLEAPGLALSSLAARPDGTPRLGVSDFIFDIDKPGMLTAEPYVERIALPEVGDRLLLMPAGTRAMDLAGHVAEYYRDPAGDAASVFQVLVAEIAERFAPDYVFFDSRTGLADIAGVCTVELPEVLVAFSSLGAQSVEGMAQVLTRLREHPARVRPVATLLVLGPIPRAVDLGVTTLDMVVRKITGGEYEIDLARRGNILFDAVFRAQSRLLPIVREDLGEVQKWFPRLREADVLHLLEYDPRVALTEELQTLRSSTLTAQHRLLARSITRANENDVEFMAADSLLQQLLMSYAG